ncbi:uncharacterized protein [Ptychodera flava]|uniref:uncharacterized protein n=1 Tax=Ptychodera flava TaxID=63121 RepID=UPI00396A72AA
MIVFDSNSSCLKITLTMLLRGFVAILSVSIVLFFFTLFWLNIDDDHFGRFNVPRPNSVLKILKKTENKIPSGMKDTISNVTSSTSLNWQQTPFKSVNTNSSTRLLLYISAIGRGGPNCQYGHFKSAVQYAITQNRSLVNSVVFYEHFMFAAHEQVTDTRTLGETYDINRLKEIVNIVSLEEFNEFCNKTVETVIAIRREEKLVTHAYSESAKLYRSAFGIALPEYEQLPATDDQFIERLEAASSMNCVGVWALHTGGLFTHATQEKVIKHLVPSLGIQHLAESIRKNVLKGWPYLAIHWRNKPNEMSNGHPLCEDVDSGNNERCEYYRRDIALMMNLTRNIAKSIQNFMKTNNLTQVYVATPPISTNFLQVLRSLGVANTFSAENITNERHATAKNDPYIWSLIEQDLCANADVFIGHHQSTWSMRVRERRLGDAAKHLTIKDFAANYTTELFSRRR